LGKVNSGRATAVMKTQGREKEHLEGLQRKEKDELVQRTGVTGKLLSGALENKRNF
jgi:hypothetical protein